MWSSLKSDEGHGPWFGEPREGASAADPEDLSGCGLNLFLASLSMLFGAALLGAVVVRLDQAEYAATIDAPLGVGLAVATALLVVAERCLARRGADVRRSLRQGIAFGLAFLAVQGWNWWRFAADGYGIRSGTLEAVLFYMLTILHALHVLGGLVALAWAMRGGGSEAGRALSLRYWRYLGVWWLALLGALLLF